MKNLLSKRTLLNIASLITLSVLIQCTKVIKRAFTEPKPTVTDMHNSANSLEWAGSYKGTLPCADCTGIVTEITLDTNRKYTIRKNYAGKGIEGEKGVQETGYFTWNKGGNTITLLGIKNEPPQYFVGENRLLWLDKDGNKITGSTADDYVLNKQIAAPVLPEMPKLSGNWELDYIAGSPMVFQELYPRNRPTINFDTTNNLISGSTSCNRFSGKLIVNGNKIDFTGPIMMTKMMCLDSKGNGENLFVETLKKVNNFVPTTDSTLNFIMGDIVTLRFSKK